MEDISKPLHKFHCNSCQVESAELTKFTFYWLQTDVLRQAFLTEELLLCAICYKIAEKAEKLIKNVFEYFKCLTSKKKGIQQHPIIILQHVTLDSVTLIEREDEPQNLEQLIENSIDKEDSTFKVKKELEEECDNLEHIEGEFVDDDDLRFNIKEEDEYPLKLLKQELELEGVRIKCFKKEKKQHKIKKKKVVKQKEAVKKEPQVEKEDKVQIIYITKEQFDEERKAAAEDDLYKNSIYQCTTCIKGFSFKDCYDKHMEKHDANNGKFVCDICKQRMESQKKLKNHLKCHTLRYKCTVCGLTRSNKLCIMDHYTAKHGEGLLPYKCPQCPKTFMRKVSVRKHIIYLHKRSTSKVECPYCHKKYVNQHSLKAHFIRRHPTEVSSVKRLKKNTCEECGMGFGSPSQLKNHRTKHSERKDYYCVECDKSFKSDSILKNHLKTASPHVNYTELPLPCQHCDKRFAIRRDLENHTNRIHLNIKPYQCDQCEKAYINSWGLREHHRLAHEGYKRPLRFPCTMCDKVFDRNQILKSHIRTHTGERPYQCDKCPAQFSQSSILGTHVKLIHLKLTRDGRPKSGHVTR